MNMSLPLLLPACFHLVAYLVGAWIERSISPCYLARDFGGGGGSELNNLAFLQYLQAELVKKGDTNAAGDALAIFNDARWINDKTASTTVPSGNDENVQSSNGLPAYLAALSVRGVQEAARAWNNSRASIKRTGELSKYPGAMAQMPLLSPLLSQKIGIHSCGVLHKRVSAHRALMVKCTFMAPATMRAACISPVSRSY